MSKSSFLDSHIEMIHRFAQARASEPPSRLRSVRNLARLIELDERGQRKVAHTTVARYIKRIGLGHFWGMK
jgi:hypothetical protein